MKFIDVIARYTFQIFIDPSNFFLLLFSLILIILDADSKNGQTLEISGLFFLLIKLLLELGINLVFFLRVSKLEKAWNNNHISKISQGVRKVWKKAPVSELKVGDLIFLQNETIVPADILILCTSEMIHTEMILYASERKITGRNKINVKNSVRNFVQGRLSFYNIDISPNINIQEMSNPAFLESFCKKMSGVVEYTGPTEMRGDDIGSLTLKNDPKAYRFGSNNILYCGSKLYSEGMIGIVLFTGKYTKVFRQNVSKRSHNKVGYLKKKLLLQVKYPILIVTIGWAFIVSMVYFLIFISTDPLLEQSFLIEDRQGAGFYLYKLLIAIAFMFAGVPVYLFTVVDMAVICVCFSAEVKLGELITGWFSCLFKFKKSSEGSTVSSEERSQLDRLISLKGKQRDSKEISFYRKDTDHGPEGEDYSPEPRGIHRHDISNEKTDLLEGRPNIHSHSSHKLSLIPNSGNLMSPPYVSSKTFSQIPSQPSSTSITASQSRVPSSELKILNLDMVLSCIGSHQIIFDKTDTLTKGKLRVGKISTRLKDYNLTCSQERLEHILEESRYNEVKYALSESDEDLSVEAMSSYSEKSQETIRELECDYNSSLQDENHSQRNKTRRAHLDSPIDKIEEEKVAQDVKFENVEDMLSKREALFKHKRKPTVPPSEDKLLDKVHITKAPPEDVFPEPRRRRAGSTVIERDPSILEHKTRRSPRQKRRESVLLMPVHLHRDSKGGPTSATPSVTNSPIHRPPVTIPPTQIQSVAHSMIAHGAAENPLTALLNLDEEEKKLAIKFEKNYTEMRLISDIIAQKLELQELLSYIMLFQNIAKSTKKNKSEKVSISLEDKALGHLMKMLSYEVEKGSLEGNNFQRKLKRKVILAQSLPNTGFEEYNLKVTSAYGYKANFIVRGINLLTNGRKRVSMLICDTQRVQNSDILIVKGSEEAMIDCLLLNQKEKSQIKQLTTIYRNAGFKQIIIGFKTLRQEELNNYRASMEKISTSKRDQLQEYEKLAMSLETDLKYIGSIGVVDNAREDAIPAIKRFKSSLQDISIFSGDSLDSCLNIVKELKFDSTDFNDPSQYFSLTAVSEKRLKFQIRRILDDVYLTLKHINLDKHSLFWNTKKTSESYVTKQSSEGSNLGITPGQDDKQTIFFEKQGTEKLKISKSSETKFKKSLLINGNTIELIKSSKDRELYIYLQTILIFTDTIIGYSMHSDHKVYMVKALQSIDKIVTTVGDGFNDIGMLSCANSGVQLLSKSVPLITADAVVKDYKDLMKIFFEISYHLLKSVLLGCVLLIWNMSIVYSCNALNFYVNHLSSVPMNNNSGMAVIIAMYIDIICFICINRSLSEPFIKSFPVVSRDLCFLLYDMTKFIIIFIISGFIESMFILFVVTMYYIRSYTVNGLIKGIEEWKVFLYIVMYINSKAKCLIMVNSSFRNVIIGNLFGPILVASYYLLRYRHSKNDIMNDQGISTFLENKIDWTCFIVCILVPFYTSLLLINWLRYNLITRYLNLALSQLNKRDKKYKSCHDRLKHEIQKDLMFLQDTRVDELIDQVRNLATENMLSTNLSKIIHIDFMTHRLGVSKYLNIITDSGERNRFTKVILRSAKRLTRYVLWTFLILLTLEYIICLWVSGSFNLQLHSGIPFIMVLTAVPLFTTYMRGESKMFQTALHSFYLLCVFVYSLLSILNPWFLWMAAMRSLSRLAFTSLPFNFAFAIICAAIMEVFRTYK
jgi:magnesium-transporting ATPase (P-type)